MGLWGLGVPTLAVAAGDGLVLAAAVVGVVGAFQLLVATCGGMAGGGRGCGGGGGGDRGWSGRVFTEDSPFGPAGNR